MNHLLRDVTRPPLYLTTGSACINIGKTNSFLFATKNLYLSQQVDQAWQVTSGVVFFLGKTQTLHFIRNLRRVKKQLESKFCTFLQKKTLLRGNTTKLNWATKASELPSSRNELLFRSFAQFIVNVLETSLSAFAVKSINVWKVSLLFFYYLRLFQ